MEDQKKKVYRSRKDRIIAGVAGGIAEYFDIDVVLVRAIFILLTLIHGVGILLYIILMIIIPKEGQEKVKIIEKEKGVKTEERVKEFAHELNERAESLAEEFREEFKDKKWYHKKRNIVGITIIILGFVFLLENIIPFRLLRGDILWPIALVLIGFYIIFKRKKYDRK
ncbi:PspC domain-containing protein [Candidatus Parcubacteria bacterium]|nr:PspC domain-containing protein [Candidatus Parcubacteria bacterium]